MSSLCVKHLNEPRLDLLSRFLLFEVDGVQLVSHVVYEWNLILNQVTIHKTSVTASMSVVYKKAKHRRERLSADQVNPRFIG